MKPEPYPQIPAPREVPPPRDDETEPEISLTNAIRFVARNWLVIVGTTGLAVVAALAWGLLFVERTWQASALLIVNEPTLSSSLTPSRRPAKAYREVLHSDTVLEETRRRVAKPNGNGLPRLNLRSEIVLDGNASPLLRIVVQSSSPELAAEIANVWAGVAIEHAEGLVTSSAERSIALAEDRHSRATRELQELEARNLEMRIGFERRTNLLTTEWESKIASALEETSRQVAAYQVETDDAFRELASVRGLGFGTEEEPRAEMDPELASLLQQLVSVRKDLAQTLPYLELERTVSEDVLWQWLGDEAAEAEPRIVRQLANLTGMRLSDHEANPVYFDLRQRATDLELGVRQSGLIGEWPGGEGLMRALERVYQARSAGLSSLLAQRQSHQNGLRATYRSEMGVLRQRFRVDVSRLRREISVADELLLSVAPTLEEAKLARTEIESSGGALSLLPAVPPRAPLPRRLPLRAIGGLVVGGLLGLVFATIREATRTGRQEASVDSR